MKNKISSIIMLISVIISTLMYLNGPRAITGNPLIPLAIGYVTARMIEMLSNSKGRL